MGQAGRFGLFLSHEEGGYEMAGSEQAKSPEAHITPEAAAPDMPGPAPVRYLQRP